MNTNQIILMLGNQTCSQSDNDYLPLKVLESYFSFGMSSLLFKTFREKNGLTYDTGVINPPRKFSAPFLIYLSAAQENGLLSLRLLSSIWYDLLNKPLTKNQLILAKTKYKSSILHSHQSIEEVLNRRVQLIGLKMNPYSEESFLKEVDLISSEQLTSIAKKYFKQPFLSVLGNKKNCQKIREFWNNNF